VEKGHTALERWQAKIGVDQKYKWSVYKKKKRLLNKLDELDKTTKILLLDENELNLRLVEGPTDG
jgi:hypothetical protein